MELYRIVTMLLIVAHHYVVNSGLIQLIYASPNGFNTAFLMLFGAWGKTGINCFVLITGYFMCKSQITLKKFAKLLLEVYFYKTVLYFAFLLTGYEPFSWKTLLRLIAPMTSLASNFGGCYLLFYLFIPFLNILLRNLTQKQHLLLVLLSLTVYTVIGGLDGLPIFELEMNYVSWFAVLYFIGSYIRMYPHRIFGDQRFWGIAMGLSLLLSVASIFVCDYLGRRLGQPELMYFFISDSNKILALTNGICSFLFFKNLKIKNSRFINTLGASTFGVLMIHAGSWTMIQWLWKTFLQNTAMFNSLWLPIHAVLCVLGVYAAATVIDVARIRFLEKPFFRFWDKQWDTWKKKYLAIEKKLCDKFQIQQ